jgi:putative spermidine/putrescine transport system permease protein
VEGLIKKGTVESSGRRLTGRLPAFVQRHGWILLAAPALVILGLFFVVPLADLFWRSVVDPSPANYRDFFTSEAYRDSLITTIRLAVFVTVSCLLLGYPYAYAMNKARPRTLVLMTLLVMIPFWSSIVVRTYAWTVWLQDTGIINDFLQWTGVTDEPVALIRTSLGAMIGMTHVMIPFMVLPLFAGMRRIDGSLVQAAQSLGATPGRAFWRIFFPLSLPGVFAGALLVFVLSLGFYITPAMLGSSTDITLSQLIVFEVNKQLRFGMGAAMGIILLFVTLATLAIGYRTASTRSLLDPVRGVTK